MKTSALPAIAVAALLVLTGCGGLVGTGDGDPSPDEFPNASAIDESVFDRHAAVLANTSFTVTFEKSDKRRHPQPPPNYTYHNSTERALMEPGASQYLRQPNGTLDHLGNSRIHRVYSNGTSASVLSREDNESTVRTVAVGPRVYGIFNESSERYLWGAWFNNYSGNMYANAAMNITYEREGTETVQNDTVMRYEASGVDALPEWARSGYTEFSTTLLLDADGVIRSYRAELRYAEQYEIRRQSLVHTVSDVGSTDVEKPDWASNATAGA